MRWWCPNLNCGTIWFDHPGFCDECGEPLYDYLRGDSTSRRRISANLGY